MSSREMQITSSPFENLGGMSVLALRGAEGAGGVEVEVKPS